MTKEEIEIKLNSIEEEILNIKSSLKELQDLIYNISPTVRAESIELNSEKLYLTKGESYRLTASVKPEDINNKQITWMTSDQSIATVSNDGLVKYLKDGTVKITAICDTVQTDCIIKKRIISNNEYLNMLDVPRLWSEGIDGSGIKIAIIEGAVSGIQDNFKVSGWYDTESKVYTDNYSNINKPISNHAFNTAGIIVGKDTGVAPGASIYNVIIETDLSKSNQMVNGLKRGIEWCIENTMDIINLSIETPIVDLELLSILKKAAEANIIIVSAFGNSGIENKKLFVQSGNIINVGAITKEKTLASFSNYGENVDFVSFGKDVPSYNSDGSKVMFAGTSCSTPFISGIIALLKQQQKDLSFKEVYYLLIDSSEDIGELGKDNKFGYGMPKAYLTPENYKTDYDIKKIENAIPVKDVLVQLSDKIIVGQKIKPIIMVEPRILNNISVKLSSQSSTIEINDLENSITALKEGEADIEISIPSKNYRKTIKIKVLSKFDDELNEKMNFYNILKVKRAGFTGKGVKVAILDSGVNEVGNIDKVNYGPNFLSVNNTSNIYDTYGSGTISASIIKSIAHDCEIYSIKIVNNGVYSVYNEKNTNQALQWCIENGMDIVIGKMLSIGYFESRYNLYKKMNDKGIITIIGQPTGDAIGKYVENSNENNIYVALLNKDNTAFSKSITEKLDVTSYYEGFPAYDNVGNSIITEFQNKGASLGIVGGICALLKEQKSDLNVTELRKLLPALCTNIGSKDEFGYGILKADLI